MAGRLHGLFIHDRSSPPAHPLHRFSTQRCEVGFRPTFPRVYLFKRDGEERLWFCTLTTGPSVNSIPSPVAGVTFDPIDPVLVFFHQPTVFFYSIFHDGIRPLCKFPPSSCKVVLLVLNVGPLYFVGPWHVAVTPPQPCFQRSSSPHTPPPPPPPLSHSSTQQWPVVFLW